MLLMEKLTINIYKSAIFKFANCNKLPEGTWLFSSPASRCDPRARQLATCWPCGTSGIQKKKPRGFWTKPDRTWMPKRYFTYTVHAKFQDPKMEVIMLVPYFWPYFAGIFPEIKASKRALYIFIYGRYLQ